MPESIAQGIRDEEHLRILGICHYVVGGFTALFASIFIIHIVMGLMVLGGGFPMAPPPGHPRMPRVAAPGQVAKPGGEAPDGEPAPAIAPEPSAEPFSPSGHAPRQNEPFSPDRANRPRLPQPEFPKAIGFLFVFIGAALVLIGWTVGGLTIYVGRCLQRRRHRTFTLIMAGINCLHIPFGTALGVFTFIVLQRPSVAALYASPLAGRPLAANV